jgi:hypothetical protein
METRPHILQIADVFRCRVVDMGSDALTLEVTGDEDKMRACTEALRAYGILEIAGSGSVALSRAGFRNGQASRGDERPVENYGFGILMAEGERLSRDAV